MNQNGANEEGLVENGNAMDAENTSEEMNPLALAAVGDTEEESNDSTSDLTTGPRTSRKRSYSDFSEETGSECPICLDNWTSTGKHRVCALKCGHLFGYDCVATWLNSQRKGTCPTCKKRVKKDDIRYIYAKKLTAIDTAELEDMRKQLEAVMEERNKAQADLARSVYRESLLAGENASLRSRLEKTQSGTNNPNAQTEVTTKRSFSGEKKLYATFSTKRLYYPRCVGSTN